MTTTEGRERLERSRDRFVQAAKESGVSARDIALRAKGRGSLKRQRHQVTTGKEVAAAAVRRCHLRLRHRHLKNGVWNTRPQ